MLKWIENLFIESQEDSSITTNSNQNNIDFSESEKDSDRFLHPITEESFHDADENTVSFEKFQDYSSNYKLFKLK